MKIKSVRARVYEWQGQDRAARRATSAPTPWTCSMTTAPTPTPSAKTPCPPSASIRLDGGGDRDRRRHRRPGQRGAGAEASPRPSSTSTWRPWCIGHDPWDYEYLWQRMYRATHAWGRKGVTMAAISAVDLAIWDILGKSVNKPVFKLLGGRTKEKDSLLLQQALPHRPQRPCRKRRQKFLDQGFKAFKMRFGYGPAASARKAWCENLRSVEPPCARS